MSEQSQGKKGHMKQDGQRPQGEGSDGNENNPPRTIIQWAIFGFGLLMAVFLIGYTTYDHFKKGDKPVAININSELSQVKRQGAYYYLPVTVHNQGPDTLENVWVNVSITGVSEQPVISEFSIPFLPADDRQESTLVLPVDPAKGRIDYQASFKSP